MKILILVAMDKELLLVREIMENPVNRDIDGMSVLHGSVYGHEIYLAKCGIGKVNAAVNAFRIVDSVHPDLVINSGVAGGAGIPVGTVLVADKVAYSDVWCGPGTVYGEADGCPLYFVPDHRVTDLIDQDKDETMIVTGLICTSDKFISTPEQISFIRSHFPEVKAVDMESAAIAQVCLLSHTPFNIVRVVSDTPGEGENLSQYEDFWSQAPRKTFNILKTILKNL